MQRNQKSEYTVFRAYNKYWIALSSLVNKKSVNLLDTQLVCGVDKISINDVLKIAKKKVNSNKINYEPFMVVKMGDYDEI